MDKMKLDDLTYDQIKITLDSFIGEIVFFTEIGNKKEKLERLRVGLVVLKKQGYDVTEYFRCYEEIKHDLEEYQ